jgi:aminopeptidase N
VGGGTVAEQIEANMTKGPAGDPFCTVRIGDPGPTALFKGAIYVRGAMTLHALRTEIGDEAFTRLVRAWTERKDRGVTTTEFVALAEEVSGRQLDALFTTWLDMPHKPV